MSVHVNTNQNCNNLPQLKAGKDGCHPGLEPGSCDDGGMSQDAGASSTWQGMVEGDKMPG